MSERNARLIEYNIMEDISATDAGDSDIIDLNGATKFSCQAIYDVQAPSAKTFDSPHLAEIEIQDLTYTSVDASDAANDITIAYTDPGSGTHALAVSVVASAISVSLESTAAVAATASLAVTTPITLTSVAAGTARDTTTFTTQVAAAAANPGATVLAAFTGTAAAIVCTITPNNGTNNGAVAVDLTTAQLRELITTGAVVGKTVTITDASNFRILQTATGGGAEVLADGGEGDGVVGTFSGGANYDVAISTADDIATAIGLSAPALLLVSVAVTGTGGDVQTAVAATNLEDGSDGEVDVADNEFDIASHGFSTGLKVRLTTTGTLPAPFLTGTDYFVIVLTDDAIQLAATLDDAQAGIAIELTDAGADDSVNTATPVALGGGSVTFQKSNDQTNWIDIQAATSIVADGFGDADSNRRELSVLQSSEGADRWLLGS